MLIILEQTPTRLVLNDNRRGMRVLAIAFILVSALSLLLLLIQSYQLLTDPLRSDQVLARRFALLMFVVVGTGFIAFGVFALLNLSRGITLILDRADATATLTAARSLRLQTREYSIYAISHFRVETSSDHHAYGLFMVLRSGENIPLAVFPEYARTDLEDLLRTLHTFLR